MLWMARPGSPISGGFPAWRNALRYANATTPTACGHRKAVHNRLQGPHQRSAFRKSTHRFSEATRSGQTHGTSPRSGETAVRREVVARQGKKPCLRIVRLLFAAATDPRGVTAHRSGER